MQIEFKVMLNQFTKSSPVKVLTIRKPEIRCFDVDSLSCECEGQSNKIASFVKEPFFCSHKSKVEAMHKRTKGGKSKCQMPILRSIGVRVGTFSKPQFPNKRGEGENKKGNAHIFRGK